MYQPCYFITGLNKSTQGKLQLSFKYALLQDYYSGIFLGYTQLSLWDIYDVSAPFRATNYMPELFFKSKILVSWLDYIVVSPYEHKSNGQDVPGSRSINRFYVAAQKSVMTGPFDIGIWLKLFGYYNYEPKKMDYPYYSNYYESKFFITYGTYNDESVREEIYVRFGGIKKRFIEAGASSRRLFKSNIRIYLQYYYGYLEDMEYFRNKTSNFRAGVMVK